MSDRILYSITGLFDTVDEILHAAGEAVKAGYTKYDVNTPYPVHGLDTRMKLKPSKLGYVALVLGLAGAAGALLLMWWTMSVEYPLVIGGKPNFTLPAFIPITFELTVLLASVGTVIAMLFFFFRMPSNAHPLHDTNYMKKVSVDKFGMVIEAGDPIFDEKKAKQFLESLGAKDVESVYFDDREISYRPRLFEPKFIIFLVLVFAGTSAAGYFVLNKVLEMQPFTWMSSQPRINAQSRSDLFPDRASMRQPVEGTIARGHLAESLDMLADTSEANVDNPLPETETNLALGKKKFDIYCSPCHGYLARGDARLHEQFPNPPSLHSEKLQSWKDGRIYHIITHGQNIMPSYAKQLTPEERWAVVLYIRVLQRAESAKESDLE